MEFCAFQLCIVVHEYKHPIFTSPPSKERVSRRRPALRASEFLLIPARSYCRLNVRSVPEAEVNIGILNVRSRES